VDETFMRLIEGTLPSDRVRELEAHCDGCSRCARTMSELARAGAPDPPGWLGGRYQMLEPLGAGSTGVVFAALDAKLRRKVAIKRLRDGDGDGAAIDRRRDRFLREAQLLASLSHPNVLTVHDVGGIDREVYVVTELVDGCPMSRWVRETEPRPDHRRIIDLYLQVGRGLSAAHHLNVVHRDVKPENILVARNGRVLIGDFGLAGLTGSTEGAPTTAGAPAPLTQTGAVLGTPAYMAPELHAGRPADPLSDQFAFCMSLYESLHGHRAFSGATAEEYVAAVRAARLALGTDGVPRAIDRVLAIGLSADPARRYPSLDALLDDLARVRDRRPLRRAWVAAGSAAGLLGVLAVVVAMARHGPQPATAASGDAPALRSPPSVFPAPAAPPPALPAPSVASPPAPAVDPSPPVVRARPHRVRAPARRLAAAETAALPAGVAAGHGSADPLLLLYMADIAHGDRDGAVCLAALDSLPDGAWPPSLAEHAQRRRATCEMLRGQCQDGVRRLEPLDGADVARATALSNCPAGSFATVEDRLLAVATQADEERYAGNQAGRRHALKQILLRQTETPDLRICLNVPAAARACSRRLAMLARAYQVMAEAYLAAGDCAEGAALDVAQSEVKFQIAAFGAGDPALRCRSPRTAEVYHQCAAAGAEAERRCLRTGRN
jgi:protein kinase-like protein